MRRWLCAGSLALAACAPVGALRPVADAPDGQAAPSPAAGVPLAEAARPAPAVVASIPPEAWLRPGAELGPSPELGLVLEAPEVALRLQPGPLRMVAGEEATWRVQVQAQGVESGQGLWASSDEGVARVDAAGRVVAVGPGRARISLHWPPRPALAVGAALTVAAHDPTALIPEIAPSEAPRGFRWVEGQAVDASSGAPVAGARLWVDGQSAGLADAKGFFRIPLRPGDHELQLHLAPRYPIEGHGHRSRVQVADLVAPLGLGPLAMKRLNWLPLLKLAPDEGSAWTLVGQQELWVGTKAGLLHRSTDGGATWTALDVGLKAPVAAVRVDGSRFRWVLGQDGSLWRSRDGAQSWAVVRPAQEDGGVSLWVEGESRLWVLGRRALQHSQDGGQSWQSLLQGRFDREALVAHPTAKHLVVVGPDGAQASSDGGDHWVAQPRAFTPAFWEAEQGVLVASSEAFGRFLSWDGSEAAFTRLGHEGPLAASLWWDQGSWRAIPDGAAQPALVGLPRFTRADRGWRLRPEALEGY